MTNQHGEAFSLMWYSCPCGHRERIWNSRDGVTPFAMACPSCGQPTMYHTEWGGDTPAPDHKLHPRQKFWRDGTVEEAIAIMERRFERSKDTYPTTPEIRDQIFKDIREGTSTEFPKGWPTLDVEGMSK